jgi:hypothetical protein
MSIRILYDHVLHFDPVILQCLEVVRKSRAMTALRSRSTVEGLVLLIESNVMDIKGTLIRLRIAANESEDSIIVNVLF